MQAEGLLIEGGGWLFGLGSKFWFVVRNHGFGLDFRLTSPCDHWDLLSMTEHAA